MRQPVTITTAFPSIEEVARAVGVPKSRVKELVELARDGAQNVIAAFCAKERFCSTCRSRGRKILVRQFQGCLAPSLTYLTTSHSESLPGVHCRDYRLWPHPSATLEIPGGARRLDRILILSKGCRYSFHDPLAG